MGFFSGNRKNQPSMPTEKTLQRIGIAGTAHHTGTTHLAINIAITLRSLNYKVAVIEDNPSKHFELIASELDYDNSKNIGYFNYKGVDYYHYCRPIPFFVLMQRNYDFLIIDHGTYANCDRNTFYANNINVITTGSRLWELANYEDFMEGIQVEERGIEIENRMSRQYNYAFMFAHDDYFFQKQILEHMGDDIKSIFPAYKENLFDDPDYDTVKQLIPWVQIPEESSNKNKSHGLFGLKFNKESENKEDKPKDPEYEEELIKQDAAISPEIPEIEDDYTIEQPVVEQPEDDSSEDELVYPLVDSLPNNAEDLPKIKEAAAEATESEHSLVVEAMPVPVITQEEKKLENDAETTVVKEKIAAEIESVPDIIPYYAEETKEIAEQLFIAAKEIQKYTMKHVDELTEDPQMALFLNAFATKGMIGAFGCLLRSKTEHSRKNGKDGEAVIRIEDGEIKYEIKESSLKEFLGEDAEYLIAPSTDSFVKL